MDPSNLPSQLQNQTNNQSQIQDELTHVNQEIYKKNLELAEKNKILSLLRRIDIIILSAVTDIKQIAQQVVNTIVNETEFIKMSTAFMIDKDSNSLIQLAMSQTEAIRRSELELNRSLQEIKIQLNDENNIIAKTANQKKILLTHGLTDVFTPYLSAEESSKMQEIIQNNMSYIYPLNIRGEVIGVMVISVEESEKSLPYYKIDLIDRIPGIVAISIDNALLFQSIQKANEHLKQLDVLKDEFVSLASHELRTPMAIIKSYVFMLLHGSGENLTEKQKKYLERTLSSTERLINLVNDILNVSRIESGKLTIERNRTDIGKLVSEIIAEMMPKAKEVGVNLLYTPPQSSLIANVDINRIKEVLINLIGNSLKFTPKDGLVTIIVDQVGKDFVLVKVKDTGRGIKSDDISKLFKKFNMVGNDHLTKDKGQGTGLGLYLSKSLVELHGGKIWAQSDGEGKGSTFSFTLPIGSIESAQTTESAVADLPDQKTNINLPPEPNQQA